YSGALRWPGSLTIEPPRRRGDVLEHFRLQCGTAGDLGIHARDAEQCRGRGDEGDRPARAERARVGVDVGDDRADVVESRNPRHTPGIVKRTVRPRAVSDLRSEEHTSELQSLA